MELKLIRKFPGDNCIIGELFVNGKFECYTLEDPERPVKQAGITAIPRGYYEVVINWSARFKKRLPLLLSVPNYSGIRIHVGNTAANTEGCILPGQKKTRNSVTQSKLAFDALFAKLDAASKKEKIYIEVTGDKPEPWL